jgi:uncharacterized repeat protein (TIGR03803 family)
MALLGTISRGAAQNAKPVLTTLYNFRGSDGSSPIGSVVIGRRGVIYGATFEGGTSTACGQGCGTVFSLTPPAAGGAWAETVIHDFALGSGDGAIPSGGVAMGGEGAIYGTARVGGASGDGIVFSLTLAAGTPGDPWTETILHSFTGGPGGSIPAGPLIDSRGVLYGITTAGGSFGSGTVFSLAPDAGGAWNETPIYSFAGSTGLLSAIGPRGALYGAGETGGTGSACYGGCGTVFSLTPPAAPGDAWTESVLYNFAGPDGASPAQVAIGRDGVLFGIATEGGEYLCCGTVFSLIPPASPGSSWTEHTLHDYPKLGNGELTYTPSSLVVSPRSGVLYGTTVFGGFWGDGTVFSLTPPESPGGAWTYTVLHEFNSSDGAGACCLAEADGVLYGATQFGGASDRGTVFSLRP